MNNKEYMAAQRAESWREELRRNKKNKDRIDIPRVHMNELDGLPNHQHRKSKPRSYERTSSYRSLQMPRLSRSFMHYRLSGRNQHPEIHQKYRTRRISRSRKNSERNQCITCRMRSGMPTRKTM